MQYFLDDKVSSEGSPGYRLRRVHQQVLAGIEPLHAAEGLNGVQWSTLMAVFETGQATSAELARNLVYDKGGMTRVLDRLEKAGLVARSPNGGDRRVTDVLLTEAGQAVAERSRARVIRQWNEWLADWTRAEVDMFMAMLTRLDRRLRAHAEPPDAPVPAPNEDRP